MDLRKTRGLLTSRVCRYVQACAAAAALAGAFACGNTTSPSPTPTPTPPPTPSPPPSPQVLVGAGDIADCQESSGGGVHAEDTARLLDSLQYNQAFTAGDNAYPNGSTADFNTCYHPRWGRHKSRTRPSPGNHEYETIASAEPYFTYFGDAAGIRGAGFYSYDLGAWHIVSLNSNVPSTPGSEQWAWLRGDLQLNARTKCQLAYFHHPRFTSGPSGGGVMGDIWQVLYDFGVDVIVNGHDHLYEVFAEQNPNGVREVGRGIRQFTVGTGGAPPYAFGPARPNSETRIAGEFGVIRLTLQADAYQWSFLRAPNGAVLDAGSGTCH